MRLFGLTPPNREDFGPACPHVKTAAAGAVPWQPCLTHGPLGLLRIYPEQVVFRDQFQGPVPARAEARSPVVAT
jgi:hypothetical protein